ncbi:unnamed protein product [Amoebophrya sp. A120]|nr:unnamed protein product [Amoebophrya sp. A120]|eukprot:GSA120T00021771001.1
MNAVFAEPLYDHRSNPDSDTRPSYDYKKDVLQLYNQARLNQEHKLLVEQSESFETLSRRFRKRLTAIGLQAKDGPSALILPESFRDPREIVGIKGEQFEGGSGKQGQVKLHHAATASSSPHRGQAFPRRKITAEYLRQQFLLNHCFGGKKERLGKFLSGDPSEISSLADDDRGGRGQSGARPQGGGATTTGSFSTTDAMEQNAKSEQFYLSLYKKYSALRGADDFFKKSTGKGVVAADDVNGTSTTSAKIEADKLSRGGDVEVAKEVADFRQKRADTDFKKTVAKLEAENVGQENKNVKEIEEELLKMLREQKV